MYVSFWENMSKLATNNVFFPHSETEVHELSEADKQFVSKRNKNPFLIERKQVDKRIESKIWL